MTDPDFLPERHWKTDAKGGRYRICPRDKHRCGCVMRECYLTRDENARFVMETLSIEERIAMAAEHNTLDFYELVCRPNGPVMPDQIVRHKGRYWECVYPRAVTVTLYHEPGKTPRIWNLLAHEVNKPTSRVPIVPRLSARARWYLRQARRRPA